MSYHSTKYRVLRRLSRWTVETAALMTMRRMPPFVSAAAIVLQGEEILMIRDAAQGMLVLPGGHLHWNESVEDGIRREVFEETGYLVEPGAIVGTFASDSQLSDRGIIRVIMEAKIVGGDARSSPEGEVAWVHAAQVREEGARDTGIISIWECRRPV